MIRLVKVLKRYLLRMYARSDHACMHVELVWAFSSDGASVQILYHVVM